MGKIRIEGETVFYDTHCIFKSGVVVAHGEMTFEGRTATPEYRAHRQGVISGDVTKVYVDGFEVPNGAEVGFKSPGVTNIMMHQFSKEVSRHHKHVNSINPFSDNAEDFDRAVQIAREKLGEESYQAWNEYCNAQY